MDRFWDLLERSVIVQALLTLIFACVVCAMLLMGRPVAQEVWIAFGAILGFWFGTKSQAEASHLANKMIDKGKER